MERKIGEIFEYNGEWYQCVEGICKENNCSFFYNKRCNFCGDPYCYYRDDHKPVVFKKLEKVGEPYIVENSVVSGRPFQKYRLYEQYFTLNEKNLLFTSYGNIVSIEIKQNQEDMEEKKINLNQEDLTYIIGKIRCDILPKYTTYDEITEEITRLFTPINGAIVSSSETTGKKLKPFDLEAARNGKPVCTRDGRKARIIAFDRRLFYKNVSYPILALVERSDGEDDVCGYNEKGKVLIEDGAEYKDDLMMLPEKHEGWVNVYKVVNGHESGKIFATEEEAKTKANDGRVATIKIEWED